MDPKRKFSIRASADTKAYLSFSLPTSPHLNSILLCPFAFPSFLHRGLQLTASRTHMAKKAREDDPNAKEPTDEAGHGGALFRDTTLGLFVRLITGDRYLKFPEERHPEYYIEKYGKKAQEERKKEVDQANRHSEEEWRQSNPRDAALEDRNGSGSNESTLDGSPDRSRNNEDNASSSSNEEGDQEKKKKAHHDTERGNDINLVGFESNDPGRFPYSMICCILLKWSRKPDELDDR